MAKVTKVLVMLLPALLKEAATANVTKETKKYFTFPLPMISQLTPQYWFLCLALATADKKLPLHSHWLLQPCLSRSYCCCCCC